MSVYFVLVFLFFFFKQKTAYEMRISDWSSDVCSSDLLAGSLVLGFLELQASQAQNRFYNELEDWLSAQTRLSSGGPVGDGDQSEIGRASCRERVCQYV